MGEWWSKVSGQKGVHIEAKCCFISSPTLLQPTWARLSADIPEIADGIRLDQNLATTTKDDPQAGTETARAIRVICLTNMARLLTLLISLLATIAAVFGCGVMLQGQCKGKNHKVYCEWFHFTGEYGILHHTEAPSSCIAATQNAASSFVSRLIMKTVFNVLEQQGRSLCSNHLWPFGVQESDCWNTSR
ncbi:hypothetical protein KIN20_000544 [Parelaphostrongylus tenuis]|uniref:Uncharacterized protein n=1 Tax=Parelaphostrongylus tenuis TaxID=148309 RepID=A0AAD5QDY7_PARTN|nr:hypothetical protein KIN20_000544 [Parelaphostrongylus tenuis]